jgi:putative ABC transport system permease protein
MLRNYIVTAIRSLKRHRFFSVINIFGLAVAMSICMAMIMLIADQMMYDRHNTKRDRIYRVNSVRIDEKFNRIDGLSTATTTTALRPELLEKYTGVEKAVRIVRGFGNNWLGLDHQNVNIPLAGYYVDPEFFDFFEFEFQHGDPATALREPYAVVLTRKAANKLFKEENPVGQNIKVGEFTYTVTGVLKETSNKSHIVFDGVASMATVEARSPEQLHSWTDFWNGWLYVLIEPNKTPATLQRDLDKIFDEHIASIKNPEVYKMRYAIQGLNEITPGPLVNNAIGPSLPWMFVYFLGGLAAVIMLTSCFNFTNLSIARSLTRAREIGVRKVTGAARWQIFVQFLSESVVVSFCSLAVACLFLLLLKPMILSLTFAQAFKWDLEANYFVFGIFVVFAALVGILAGLFPAVVLSGFNAVSVLKNLSSVKLFSRVRLRKVLLVSQFTLSLLFILTVIVMYNQLNFFMSKDHGFSMANNVMVKLNNTDATLLKNELLKYNNIDNVSAASHVPAAGTSYGDGFKKSADEKEWTSLNYFLVDEDYIRNMEVKLIAGKFFSAEQGESNKNFLVINEEAVKAFHYESPIDAIGEEVIYQPDSLKRTIIGVIRNYNHEFLFAKISPMALMYAPDRLGVLQVKYTGTHEAALESINKAWAKVNPDLKIDFKDLDDEIHMFYDTILGDAVNIFTTVTCLAIIISCLGLLGMATYTTETRLKEISIRKILGSSNGALIYLLSKGFLSIIIIAILIAVPAAYFLNTMWLELIAYHINFDIWTIVIGVLFLLLFGGITIGSQTWRAAFINPVDNLKNE